MLKKNRMEFFMTYLFWCTAGYLSGSVLYAYLIPKQFCHVDIRTLSDDGNPGTANAFKYAGFLQEAV